MHILLLTAIHIDCILWEPGIENGGIGMKRRNLFAGISSYFLMRPAVSAANPPASTALSTGRYLELEISPQAIVVENGSVISLVRNQRNRYLLRAVSLSQGLLWEHMLPQAAGYFSCGTASDGSILLHAQGFLNKSADHIVGFNPGNANAAAIGEVSSGASFQYAGPDLLLRAFNGSVDAFSVTAGTPAIRRIGVLEPNSSDVNIELCSAGIAVIVNRNNGACSSINVPAGHIAALQLKSAELTAALAWYAGILDQHPAGAPRVQPQIVLASGSSKSRFYLLLSPYKADGTANLLSASGTGQDIRLNQIVLPSRFAVGNPMKLAWYNDHLYVLFTRGSYATYAVQS